MRWGITALRCFLGADRGQAEELPHGLEGELQDRTEWAPKLLKNIPWDSCNWNRKANLLVLMQRVQEGETHSQRNFSRGCFHRLCVRLWNWVNLCLLPKARHSSNSHLRCLFLCFKCCSILECVGLSLWKHDLYLRFLETGENGPLSPRGLCFLGQLYNSGYVLHKRIFFFFF